MVGDTLHVFDMLEGIAGLSYRYNPYSERLSLLVSIVPSEFTAIKPVYAAYTGKEKISLLGRLRRENKEGVVIKNLTGIHKPGKTSGSADQLKYKFVESASFLVTLVHPTKRSVSLGLYAGCEIADAGNVTIPPNQSMPKVGVVVEVRYLYACITRDRSWSEYFFDQGAGNRLNGVGGTLWAAYNGVTEWVDHRRIR